MIKQPEFDPRLLKSLQNHQKGSYYALLSASGMEMSCRMNMMMKRWAKPNGYRQVLSVSLPLAASMGSLTLMQFTDRVFLANYSVDAISAVLPAGIAAFACISFFKGTANYTNAFVAQYIGARAFNRVGSAVWQGIYFSIFASCLLASFYFI